MASCGIVNELACSLGKAVPGCRVYGRSLGDKFVTHGAMDALYKHYGLDAASVARYVQEVQKVEN